MKKLLLSTCAIVLTMFYAEAQQIELIGKGVKGLPDSNLQISDPDTAEKAAVFAISKGLYALPPDNGVLIDNGDTPSSTWSPITGSQFLSLSPDVSVGYYYRSIEGPLTADLNATINIKDYIHSFYAFIYRSNPAATYTSYVNLEHVFMFRNGSDDDYVYEFEIETANSPRDITVRIPVSELDTGPRMMVVDIDAGPISQRFVDNTFNKSNSLLLAEYTLKDVPGYVKSVTVSIFSPVNGDPSYSGNGDSFFIGGVLVNVDNVFDGCTYTQGYWKNHSDCKSNPNGKGPKRDDTWDELPEGEETEFFLSEQDYCEVFETNPGKGGKYYILAHQYIAAQLNLFNDADPTDIEEAFKEATTFLNDYTPQNVLDSKDLQGDCVRLGGILDDFNNGRIGPGHCDDNDEESAAIKQGIQKNQANVYPNPVSDLGKISFTSKMGGKTSVEIYNISGQKMGTLFNGETKSGDEVMIEFSVLQLKKGLYFALIKNGSDVFRKKISVER